MMLTLSMTNSHLYQNQKCQRPVTVALHISETGRQLGVRMGEHRKEAKKDFKIHL